MFVQTTVPSTFWAAPSMLRVAAPGGGLPLAASVADVTALVAELAAVFAVSVAELAFSEADLSLEQPAKPPTTIAALPTATTSARFTTVLLRCGDPSASTDLQ
jgi:hypothetical protein